jgi:hypothetical protein
MKKILSAIITLVTSLYNRVRGYDTPQQLLGSFPLLVDGAITYPGHMAFANKGGEYFHGCRVAKFRTVQDLNEFFLPGNAGHLKLVAEIIPAPDGLIVVFNNKLSAEDMEDIEEFSRNQNQYFAEKREKRRLEKLVEEEDKLKAQAEEKSMAEIGRKYVARTKKIKDMAPGADRKAAEKKLNSGELDE